jgi:hypothetical protein
MRDRGRGERAFGTVGGVVGGPVVDDDDLEVAIGLFEHRRKRALDEAAWLYAGTTTLTRGATGRRRARRASSPARERACMASTSASSTPPPRSARIMPRLVRMNGTRHSVRSSARSVNAMASSVSPSVVAQHAEHVQRIGLVGPHRENVAVGPLRLVEAPGLLGVERAAHQRIDRRRRRDRGVAAVSPWQCL